MLENFLGRIIIWHDDGHKAQYFLRFVTHNAQACSVTKLEKPRFLVY
jgi:hypothetical protein